MADSEGDLVSKSNEENLEEESTVTMVDVLEEEKKLEEDAFAVLGASDDVNCTYNQGYMKRQALYACKTCYDINSNLAGICLACSYHCHEGHDLVELYTKRNFRCDCGNSLFGDRKCNLQPEKDHVNTMNNYNQNFKGVYCTCARPYPDPDDNTLDEMIQCIVCEDWYHTRHLSGCSVVPGVDDYSEMICHFCTDKLSSFLSFYKGYSVSKIKNESAIDSDKEIVVDEIMKATSTKTTASNSSYIDTSVNSSACGDGISGLKNNQKVEKEKDKGEVGVSSNISSSLPSSAGDSPALRSVVGNNGDSCSSPNKISDNVTDCLECKLKLSKKIDNDGFRGASFWREGFRNILCRCNSCVDLYKTYGVDFLINPLDTVQAYEEEGERKRNEKSRTAGNNTDGGSLGSGYEQGLRALSTLDRIKQVEAIHRYNEMQEHLKAYLAKFAENKKVVRAEDIKEFFSEMESRKRQKVQVPYFCH